MHHETRTHTKRTCKTTGSTPSQYQKQGIHFLRQYTPPKSASGSLLPFLLGMEGKEINRSQCASSTFWEQRK